MNRDALMLPGKKRNLRRGAEDAEIMRAFIDPRSDSATSAPLRQKTFLPATFGYCLMIGLLLCGGAVRAAGQNLDLQEGATITGNRELPKVLYIVPWKKPDPADLGAGAGPSMMDEVLAPVDREVFTRQLQYYDALHSPW